MKNKVKRFCSQSSSSEPDGLHIHFLQFPSNWVTGLIHHFSSVLANFHFACGNFIDDISTFYKVESTFISKQSLFICGPYPFPYFLELGRWDGIITVMIRTVIIVCLAIRSPSCFHYATVLPPGMHLWTESLSDFFYFPCDRKTPLNSAYSHVNFATGSFCARTLIRVCRHPVMILAPSGFNGNGYFGSLERVICAAVRE